MMTKVQLFISDPAKGDLKSAEVTNSFWRYLVIEKNYRH